MELSAHPRGSVWSVRYQLWLVQRLAARRRAPARGFTLIELLVGCALVAILGLVIGGILFTLIGSERLYLAQTDRYESLRLPANLIVQDARYAYDTACDWRPPAPYLRLYLDPAYSDYIEYQLEKVGSGSPTASPWRMKRVANIGGSNSFEYVVDDLAVNGTSRTKFFCPITDTDKHVEFTLVRRAPPAGGQELRFQGTALLR